MAKSTLHAYRLSSSGRRLRFETLEERNVLSVNVQLASAASGLLESANGESVSAALSADGRYVAFSSTATNLVSGMQFTSGVENVYRYDRLTHETELVSVNSAGTGGSNGRSFEPSISADGMVIAFESSAKNLDPSFPLTGREIYVRDMSNGITKLASVDEYGNGAGLSLSRFPVISANGKVVAFVSQSRFLVHLDTDTEWDIFARNLETNTTYLVSVNAAGTASGNGLSENPVISDDGTVVAYGSLATNLDPRDTNSEFDVFARNLVTQTTELVSVNSAGTSSGNDESGAARISGDGTRIVFESVATDLDPIDTDRGSDAYVRDLATDITHLISVNAAGTGGSNGESLSDVNISADGNVVTFTSDASNLDPLVTDRDSAIFARNLSTNALSFVRAGGELNLNRDGSIATFVSTSNTLSPLTPNSPYHEEFNVFVHNFNTGVTELLSVNASHTGDGNGQGYTPAISDDGGVVAFYSYASNLVPGDDNSQSDVFVATFSLNVPQLPGDFNFDGVVDSSDSVTWRKTQGQNVPAYSGADGSGNGVVGPEDYDIWRAHFGETIPAGSGPSVAATILPVASDISQLSATDDSALVEAKLDADRTQSAGIQPAIRANGYPLDVTSNNNRRMVAGSTAKAARRNSMAQYVDNHFELGSARLLLWFPNYSAFEHRIDEATIDSMANCNYSHSGHTSSVWESLEDATNYWASISGANG